jgi:hypothetical protein
VSLVTHFEEVRIRVNKNVAHCSSRTAQAYLNNFFGLGQ